MRIVKTFEKYNIQEILIIVDVQKSFRSYFTEMYLNQLKNYQWWNQERKLEDLPMFLIRLKLVFLHGKKINVNITLSQAINHIALLNLQNYSEVKLDIALKHTRLVSLDIIFNLWTVMFKYDYYDPIHIDKRFLALL